MSPTPPPGHQPVVPAQRAAQHDCSVKAQSESLTAVVGLEASFGFRHCRRRAVGLPRLSGGPLQGLFPVTRIEAGGGGYKFLCDDKKWGLHAF